MNSNIKKKMKKILNYTKNTVLALVILFAGLILLPIICVLIFLKIADPTTLHAIAMLEPASVDYWLTQLVMTFFTFAPSVALIVWTIRDSKKFKEQGVQIRPYLWGVGMVFPLVLIFFPLYFIRRNVTWLKEKERMISANEDTVGLRGWYKKTDSVTENTKIKINKVVTVLKWVVIILVGLFGLGVLFQVPWYIENKNTTEQVAKIHATKLTMDDVIGKYLPPDPGPEADKTIAGIDANQNGIRDDVELAIFKEYQNSAKTRAVLLQYALALQMEAIQPIVNTETVTEVVREQSRAHYCVGEITSRENLKKFIEIGDKLHGFIESKQWNTLERINARKDFVKKIGSYSESENNVCDIDILTLSS